MKQQLMTSNNQEWETPALLFKKLNDIFYFNLDIAASHTNHLCSWYFTKENSALDQPWIDTSRYDNCANVIKTAYCNPPYIQMLPWFKKFKEEFDNGWDSVILCSARTETKWFKIAWDYAKYIIFLYGRLKFTLNNQEIGVATFPSVIIVFSNKDWDLKSFEDDGKIIKLR